MSARINDLMVNGVLLLDGGMGQELRRRTGRGERALMGAMALLEEPDLVRAIHADYIRAGARVITTNSYALARTRLEEATGLGGRFEELMALAGQVAVEARNASGEDVLVAGSLPPLRGSFRPDRVGPIAEIEPIYREHAALLAPHVDLFICETMSTSGEALAAARAAASTGRPVWVSWTLADEGASHLRSGESLAEAWAALDGVAVEAVLTNCCWPESVGAAMPTMAKLGAPHVGGYGNGFGAIGAGWSLEQGVGALGKRGELDPVAYARHVRGWIADGATIVGGCCEIGPAHIAELHRMLREDLPEPAATV